MIVDGDRIVAVQPHDPSWTLRPGRGTDPIDGAGRTLLPGLIDAHAHYTFDPTEGSIAVIARRSDAEIVLAAAGHAARRPARRHHDRPRRRLDPQPRGRAARRDRRRPTSRARGSWPPGTAVGITRGHGYQFGLEADGPVGAGEPRPDGSSRDGADVVKVVASEAAMLTTTGLARAGWSTARPELTEDELRAIVETAGGARASGHEPRPGRRVGPALGARPAWPASSMPGSPTRPAIEALAASGAPSSRRSW